ncbi:ribosomal protein L17 [Entophlyctis helioformis]|nr:ribosomal protein L17 [Entophlyctis helioformis]
MKHGIRFWQKKLGRSPTHRKDLMSNLLTELVEHEQIHTTVAKAKFVKHEMETMINRAKRGSQEDWEVIRNTLFSQERSVPKLMKTLAERYQDRPGGYLRIIRNGYNSSGSDRAPRAIVELVNNSKDLMHKSAKVHGDLIVKQLQDIEGIKYHRETVTLVDPLTGTPVEVFKLQERGDLNGAERKRLTAKEVAIHKRLAKLRTSLSTFESARTRDARTLAQLPPIAFDELRRRLQTEVEEIAAKGRSLSEKFKHNLTLKGFEVVDGKVVALPGAEQSFVEAAMAQLAISESVASATAADAAVAADVVAGEVVVDAASTAAATSSAQEFKETPASKVGSFTKNILAQLGLGGRRRGGNQ